MPRNNNRSLSDDYISESDDDAMSDIEDDFCGCVLKDRYILITDIGAGSFATVYLSYDYKDKKYYAIKVQNEEEYDCGKEEVDTFKMLQTSKSPYINNMLNSFIWESEIGEHVCMVFELLAGTIYDLLNKGKKGIHIQSVKKIIYQVLQAMDTLNSDHGLLHTDIKPENVLLVGISNKVQSIIDEFEELNFHKIYNKKRKKHKHINLEDITIDLVSKLSCNLDRDSDSSRDNSSSNSRYNSSSKNSETSEDSRSSTEHEPEEVAIDDKYTCYDNLHIKLSDFGSSYKLTDKVDFKIQTRYYRAPDIILEYPFNDTCDIWSVGCMIYEMITGEILFDPIKKKRFNRDRYHIYDMQCKLGLIPQDLLNVATKKKYFFRNNGLIKGRDNICHNPLSELLRDRIGNRENELSNDQELETLTDLILNTLNYYPTKRLNTKQCLKHPWFSEYL